MKPMRSTEYSPRQDDGCGSWCAVLREAVDWVFVAAAFGILFNLYDTDGIELKPAPKAPPVYQNRIPDEPVTYAGIQPGRSVTVAAPKSAGLPVLSLQGARLRYGKAVFVDARPARDYAEGHIAGAVGFDVNDFDRAAPGALPAIPSGAEAVVYCSGGDCDDSVMLAKKLGEMGYRTVKLYEGGYSEWKKAGLPTRTGDAP